MNNLLKGKKCAVTGALRGMTRHEAEVKITEVGGIPVKSVSTKVDFVIVGGAPGSKVEKARAAGIRILNQEQFEAILKGGTFDEVEALEPEAEVIEEIPLADTLGQLRGLIYNEPSRELWEQICELLLHCPSEDIEVALDYVEQTTGHWPTDVRFTNYGVAWEANQEHRNALPEWINQILNGQDSPIYRIVRVLDLAGRDLVGKVANRIFECPSLSKVTYLQLARNRKLPGTFYEKLRTSEQFTNLTHLNLSETTLSASAVKGFVGDTSVRALTHLSLHYTRFASREDIELFFLQPIWHHLKHLDLWGCETERYTRAGVDIAKILIKAEFAAHLERLYFAGNQLCSNETTYVPMFETPIFPELTHLSLASNDISNPYVEALGQASYLRKLKMLNLDYGKFGAEAGATLFAAPQWEALEDLSVVRASVGPKAIQKIVENPHLAKLKSLNLYDTKCDTETALALLDAPHLASLESLNLGDCPIDSEEVLLALAKATHLQNLRFFAVFCKEPLSKKLWKALAEAPHLSTLMQLHLQIPEAPDKECQKIIKKSPYLLPGLKDNLCRGW